MPKSGEGSKGGTVIGHTKSGKAIYKHGKHAKHSSFNAQDHRDAANLHYDVTERAHQRLSERREEDPKFKPTNQKGAREFIMHHHKMMVHHQRKSNNAMDRSEERRGRAEQKQEAVEQRANLDTSWHDTLKTAYAAYEDRKKVTKSNILKGGPGSGRRGHKTKEPSMDYGAVEDAVVNAFESQHFTNLGDLKDYVMGLGLDAAQDDIDDAIDEIHVYNPHLEKGGQGSGRKGHKTEGLSETQIHDRRTKFAGGQYAKFRHHSGEGLNDADKFKHGMVQDAKNFGYINKSNFDLLSVLEKAKYIKREGSKGNYKYTYKESGQKRKRRFDAKDFQEVKRDLEIIGNNDFAEIMKEIENEHPHGRFASDLAQVTMIEIGEGHNFDQAMYNSAAEIMQESGHNIETASDEHVTTVFRTAMQSLKMFRKKMDKRVLDIESGKARANFTPKAGHEPIGLIHPDHDDYSEAKAVAVQMEYFKIDKSKEEEVKSKVAELTGGQSDKATHDRERSEKLFNELREIDPALSTALKTWTKHDNKRAKREELTKMATEVLKDRVHLLPDAKGPMFRFPGAESGIIKDIIKNPDDYVGGDKKLKIKDDEFASFSTAQGMFAFDEAQAHRKKVVLWIDDEESSGKLIGNLSAVGSESEALIPPGTEFSVKSVSSMDDFIMSMPDDKIESFIDIFNDNLGVKKVIHITKAKKAA